ncbi:MAG TPA: hypothetical protein VFY69_10825 [Solirubrobacterales bacterium]|nr:hypothetical protein [Solirubrobacterales bacterium]
MQGNAPSAAAREDNRVQIRGVLALLLGAALFACIGAGSASAACPNEAFRVGASALLPECRAYEQVSPVDKNGSGVLMQIEASAALSGDAANFYSATAFAGAPSSPLMNGYIARRGADNWTTESTSAPLTNIGNLVIFSNPANSAELDKSFQYGTTALTPGAVEGGSNIYVRDNLTGEHSLVAAKEGNALFQNTAGFSTGRYLDATPDFSHVVFTTAVQLLPEADPNGSNVYEFTGGELRVVNRLPDGTVTPGGGRAEPNGGTPWAHAISDDGSRIYFNSDDSGTTPLYMREDGATTIPISASQKTGEEGVVAPANFYAASADGSIAYFSSTSKLTDASTASPGLYRYDVESGQLTDLFAGLAVATGFRRVMAVSEDGSHVYFAARGALTPGSVDAGTTGANLYLWHAGTLKHIALLPATARETQGPSERMASPSGDQFAFATVAPLSPEDPKSAACPGTSTTNELCRDVYNYDTATGLVTCLTCTGAPGLGHSHLGGQEFKERGMGDRFPLSVLEDGSVFFDTPNRLLVGDVNGVQDAYGWRQGARWLVSTGTDPAPSNFADASPDGSNVFLRTGEPLVPQDVDANNDVYVARVNGGLAGQYPPAPPPPCEGEACRSGSTPTPAPAPSPGTEGLQADDNLPAECLALERSARAADRRAGALRGKARKAGKAGNRRAARKLRGKARKQQKKANRLGAQARNCGGQG